MNSQREHRSSPVWSFGGAEVFLSFLQTMQQQIDEDSLSPQVYEQLVRSWGQQLATQNNITGALYPCLEQLSQLLSTIGLLRVLEPTEQSETQCLMLALRCMASRYVGAPRIKNKQPVYPFLSLFLEGALQHAGHKVTIREQREGRLRSDELFLILQIGSTGS
ncbi:MAG TPA: hypothetical protein DCE42_25385 [Myxococcales bacterium]|nr:hypothetical protein [Deltaproteobacteria bacterium]HAA58121.1 hypothetical protein [Myxococcales bacterium]